MAARYRLSDKIKRIKAGWWREDRERLADDFREVLSTRAGRNVLMMVAELNRVFGQIGGATQEEILIHVGRHNLAQDILDMANGADCETVALARKERNEVISNRNARIKALIGEYGEREGDDE